MQFNAPHSLKVFLNCGGAFFIFMKKILFVFIIFNCSLIFGREISVAIRPFISYNNDTVSYSIYDEEGQNLVSKLDWEALYLFKPGIEAGLSFKNWSLNFSGAIAIPAECGIMYDSDWYTPKIKTNLAKSRLDADLCYDLKIQLSHRFFLPKGFCVAPLIAYNYSHSVFRAKDTVSWCGDSGHTGLYYDVPWNNEQAVKVSKFGIDFFNDTSIFFIGAGLEKVFGKWQLEAEALVSPFIYISSIDHHLNNYGGRYFLLIQKGWFSAFNLNLNCTYSIDKKNSLYMAPAFSYCKETRGVFYFGQKESDEKLCDQPCGFSFVKFSLKIGWEFIF